MIQYFIAQQTSRISRRALAHGMEPDANACRLIESYSDFDWCEVSTS
jgi:hypothetical protein